MRRNAGVGRQSFADAKWRQGIAALLLVLPLAVQAQQAAPQGGLLKQVRDSNRSAAQLNAAREQRFARERDEEAARLRAVQAELARNQARSAAARRRWEQAHKGAAELEKKLEAATRDLDTLYDASRGAAVDLHDRAQASLLTAQFPQRMATLAPLAASAQRPAAAELEQIWKELQFEVEQSGKAASFKAQVVTEEGQVERKVLRAGVFAAVADGEYFALYPGGKELLEMDRQPSWRLQRIARRFEQSDAAVAPMVIDPARGALLLAEANQPGLFERLWHSGVGGYFIAAILLMAIGLAIVQPLWLRSRLIIDEQSIGVVVGVLAAFALVQWLVWEPGEPAANEESVAMVDLVSEEEQVDEDEPPPPELEAPPPPPPVAQPDSSPSMPAMTAPGAAPVVSNIQIPVKIGGGSSLAGAGFGGFARGGGNYGRGQGFSGKPLVPLSTARPQMPEWACKQGIKGWVEAVFTVMPNGRVQDVKIVDAQPRGVYEIAAIESISNWIYAETDRAREVKQRVPMDPADCAFNWR